MIPQVVLHWVIVAAEETNDLIELIFELGQNSGGNLESFLVFWALGFVFNCQWHQVILENVLELQSQVAEILRALSARELDSGRSNHSVEELSLKDDLPGVVDVNYVDAAFIFDFLLNLVFVLVVADVLLRLGFHRFLLGCIFRLIVVDLIKLGLLICSKQDKLVLGTFAVEAVELGQCSLSINKSCVSQEPPHLLEGHSKGLFALVDLNLSGIGAIPLLEL